MRRHTAIALTIVLTLSVGSGCSRRTFDAARATRAYPLELHEARAIDLQVFREGQNIRLVNTTATSYRDFDLWLNQRFMAPVDQLLAGETRRLSLWEFYDELGEVFYAGGFFRSREPEPLWLVQIQEAPDQPLIGLITIPSEGIERRR